MIKSFFINLKRKLFYTYLVTLINFNSLIRYVFNLLAPTFVFIDKDNTIAVSNNFFVFEVFVIFLQILICFGFIYSYAKKTYKKDDSFNNALTSNTQKAASELAALNKGNLLKHRIFNFKFVSKIERNCQKGSEIWVVTGDLEEDVTNEELIEIIQNNLEKGVKYKYFISKVGGKINPSAKLGKEKLQENHPRHFNKELQCLDISAELIAPDIDIIIYNATSFSLRKAFVCVEMGNDENSYVYQELEPRTVQQIIDSLNEKNLHNVKKTTHKHINFMKFLSSGAIIYSLVSAGALTVLGFSKILTVSDFLLSIIPATLLYIFTYITICGLNFLIEQYEKHIEEVKQDNAIFSEVLSEKSLFDQLEQLKMQKQNDLFSVMNLGEADKIFNINRSCKTIWILSNLSHDFATSNFVNWLEKTLEGNTAIKCNVLYTETIATTGRLSPLKYLKNKFPDQIESYSIDGWEKHNIWSETYGIIFLEGKKNKHSIYVSLGKAEDTVYKKVLTTEDQAATILGILYDKIQ